MAKSIDRLHPTGLSNAETEFRAPPAIRKFSLPRINVRRLTTRIGLAVAIVGGTLAAGYSAGFDPNQMFKGRTPETPTPSRGDTTVYLPDFLAAAKPDLETVSLILEQAQREKEAARIAAEAMAPQRKAGEIPVSTDYLPQTLKDARVDSETASREIEAAQREVRAKAGITISSGMTEEMTPSQAHPVSIADRLKALEAAKPDLETYERERNQIFKNP